MTHASTSAVVSCSTCTCTDNVCVLSYCDVCHDVINFNALPTIAMYVKLT